MLVRGGDTRGFLREAQESFTSAAVVGEEGVRGEEERDRQTYCKPEREKETEGVEE